MFEAVIGAAIGIIILALILKLVSIPIRLFWKFITNSIIGALMLWVVNLFGAGVPIDILRALIAGIFGIPGVIVILLYQYL
ncbi:pro-sigmaK processing inhibitor BofA family protein [Selenomonas sp.]|uniref:pro-sigmaK processing inhibitor BofA family protein n=1 Tax=Selenomonas sp. TaxID=2053611 RepID=UPI0025E4DFBA|nr:pro-sigmaK processing inhibitor BofA family protein [Selenomonas sp.]MCI6086597.1 pro-sigmaK processing inhibitor BofA family protein [Selenomonas sp.]MCI6282933.1 pro-sigmaK processing inhibitor BofA family protein [Selenomonas sp.]MDY3298288.1 pro-sigmaK processing inhibitor BofA family protein [Selenomonas sp.]MDY4417231.1 pro-sigmaK processing inhibitor BofA family protein [Selenomonas sp.]